MECQASDSKKLFKVFDSSKRKRARKKLEGLNDSNSLVTDESNSAGQATVLRTSTKTSLQDVPTAQTVTVGADRANKSGQDSSPSPDRGDHRDHRTSRTSRGHRHSTSKREGMSLALKAGMVSTPRSSTPHRGTDGAIESLPKGEDSFIYAFLEETIKMDKKRQRHQRHHEERHAYREERHANREERHASHGECSASREECRASREECSASRERDESAAREHRHQHRRRRDHAPKERHSARSTKEESSSPVIDQAVLFQTFAKLCAQMNEKGCALGIQPQVPRTLSHKSLQCEVTPKHNSNEVDNRPVRLHSDAQSRDNVAKSRSHEHFKHHRDCDRSTPRPDKHDKCMCCCGKDINQYASKVSVVRSRARDINEQYPLQVPVQSGRCNVDNNYRPRVSDYRCSRDYDREYPREKYYENDKRRCCEQKTSRSFDVHREYPDVDKYYRRTARSDNMRDKAYDEKDRYYDEKRIDAMDLRDRYVKDSRAKRNVDHCDRNSIASREEDARERDRFLERERDSGLSVADGEASTISGKSNYMKVVKQEIAEQRETMDKMMKLWKELMRCFKGLSTQGPHKNVQESAASAQESAAEQLRLWRECMRRYETVARDVGDTDARLMEEINKQRSEMAEMASMWQECLQRYREISTDFDTLKKQVNVTKQHYVPSESPPRLQSAPVACAEGEPVPPVPYRLPTTYYPQMPVSGGGCGYGGSPLRGRASAPAPPPWWWTEERARSPRRRSSPDSRGSRSGRDRDRDRRHRDERRPDNSRYKEKSKPSGARSEHRHRKR